jgi:hypothetical protein
MVRSIFGIGKTNCACGGERCIMTPVSKGRFLLRTCSSRSEQCPSTKKNSKINDRMALPHRECLGLKHSSLTWQTLLLILHGDSDVL